MRIVELWQLAGLAVTGFTLFPLSTAQTKSPNLAVELPAPIPPITFETSDCYSKRWMIEPSFMMWLMRIQYTQYPEVADSSSKRLDMSTGSLISRRHVLTSCYPTLYVEQAPELGLFHVVVIPAFVSYAGYKPDGEKGTFPWALEESQSEVRDCVFDTHFSVHSTIAPRGCNIDFAADVNKPFLLNATATNSFLILALRQEIPLKSANSQYMPYDFDVDRNLGTVRWYQSYRKARCVIPRWKERVDEPIIRVGNIQHFEQEGFTYRALPYEQKCLPQLCSKYCNGSKGHENCYGNCTQKTGPQYRGRLLCLKRMNENILGLEKYSTVLDVDGVHTDYAYKEPCRQFPSAKGFDEWVVNGAPVVCKGAVIAIVSQCFEEFLVASTLTPIHHQLFKLGPIF